MRAILCVCLLLAVAHTTRGAAGALDLSFNGTGKLTQFFPSFTTTESANAVAVQPDSKIVVVGSADTSFGIARLNPDGTPDTGFGFGGKLTTSFGGASATANGVVIQTDGRIVVAGATQTNGNNQFAVARYLTNGTLDFAFGTQGKATFAFGVPGFRDYANAVALQPDGKILLAGTVYSNSVDFCLVRLNTNGTLDTTFGNGGMAETDFPSGLYDEAYALALQPDGRIIVVGGAYSGTVITNLTSAELYDPATGLWTPAGTLASGRQNHTATLLPGGNVLVAGGFNLLTGRVAGVEIFNPSLGSWLATNSMANPHESHTATLLTNGQLLVAGGVYPEYLPSVELYNPSAGTWKTTNSLLSARDSHTATLLTNGQVLVAGGYNYNMGGSAISNAEVFNPINGNWTAAGALNGTRAGHAAVLLSNGQVLAIGGFYNNGLLPPYGGLLSSAELYNPATGQWTNTGSLQVARDSFKATLLTNGTVLVTGGNDQNENTLASAELFDPGTGNWTALSNQMASARIGHTATLLGNGKVLVAGGANSSGTLSSAELFDPATKTWTNTGSMSVPRGAHTATLLSNGKVLVVSGKGYTTNTVSHDVMGIARYGTNGVLDASFGLNGLVTAGYGTRSIMGNGAAVQPDGKILVGGRDFSQGPNGITGGFVLARLLGDGRLDETFAGSGLVDRYSGGSSNNAAYGMILQTNGQIVMCGSSDSLSLQTNKPVLWRFNPDGLTDFDGTNYQIWFYGLLDSNAVQEAKAIARQSNGNLAVAGYFSTNGNSDMQVFQVTTNLGINDPVFRPATNSVRARIANFPTLTGPASAAAVVVQPDGKIVVAGSLTSTNQADIGLARYLPGGQLDVSFASGGLFYTNFDGRCQYANDAILQPDGKLVVALQHCYDATDPHDSFLLRLLSDGTVDTGFGTNGRAKVTFNVPFVPNTSGYKQLGRLSLQADGKILIGGNAFRTASYGAIFCLARYNVNGTPDTGFGTNSAIVIDTGADDWNYSMAIQPDGKIVTGGTHGSEFSFRRFLTNGTPDPGFASGGVFVGSFGGNGRGVVGLALLPDGRIVGGGTYFPNWDALRLVCLTPTGNLDPGFGSGGVVNTSLGGLSLECYAVSLERDGKILVGGSFSPAPQFPIVSQFMVARFLTNGVLDSGFGTNGLATSGSLDSGRALAVQRDGRILMAGSTYNGSGNDNWSIERFLNDQSNAPPAISAIADQTIAENSNITIPFTVFDADTPAGQIVLSAFSSNPGLLPASSILLGGTSTNRTVALTPLTNTFGTAMVTLQADDGATNTSVSFQLTVVAANPSPPLLGISLFHGPRATPRGSGNFVLAASPNVGNVPAAVAALDVNGDGKVDLVSANVGDNTLTILTNHGSGIFVSNATLNVSGSPYGFTAADINGDGRPDLICANYQGTTLSILTNNGSGGFVLASQPDVGNYFPRALAAADVNGDGRIDIVCANYNYSQGTLTVLTNDGRGSFVILTQLGPITFPVSVAAADLNGDGRIDFVSANAGNSGFSVAGTYSVFTNDGHGGFPLASTLNSTVNGAKFVAAADLNGDGKTDLIGVNNGENTLSLFTNNGGAGFAAAGTFSVGSGPAAVVAADVNGDGRLDLIAANYVGNTLSVLTNNGSGGFSLIATLAASNSPAWITVADVNQDGLNDLISTRTGSNGLVVLTNIAVLSTNTAYGVLLSWSNNAVGFGLQQNSNLAGANWSAVPVAPVVTNGQKQVFLPITNRQFYRLSSP